MAKHPPRGSVGSQECTIPFDDASSKAFGEWLRALSRDTTICYFGPGFLLAAQTGNETGWFDPFLQHNRMSIPYNPYEGLINIATGRYRAR